MPVDMNRDQPAGPTDRMPFSTESFRVRCPHCSKLYLVQYNDIQEAKPRFECSQCHERFWLSLPDMDLASELMGLPLQVKEAPQLRVPAAPKPAEKKKTEPCPKCFKINEAQARECAHCGVLIAKAKAATLSFEEPLPAHSGALASAWKKVVADYGTEKFHEDFIRMAQNERNLPYAAAQYGQMRKLMPADEITSKRIGEIQVIANSLIPPRDSESWRPRMYPRLWQIPLLGAAILIVVGLTVPMFRNVVGLGAAFLFLAIAMQLHFRRK